MSNFENRAKEVIEDVNFLARFTPDGSSAFKALVDSLDKSRLTSKESRTLFGAAFAVASQCERCASRTATEAARTGIKRDTLKLALERGVLMATGPAALVAAQALVDYDRAAPRSQTKANSLGRIGPAASQQLQTPPKFPATVHEAEPGHRNALH